MNVWNTYDDVWEAWAEAERLHALGRKVTVRTVLEANASNVAGREIRTTDRWVVLFK